MRFSLCMKIGNIKLFGMLSQIQIVKGLSSKITDKTHIFMCDMETCSLETVINSLMATKKYFEKKYKREFSNIYIMSDKENSYRAISFTKLNYKQLIELLAITNHLDGLYLYYTILDKKAILRISDKIGRKFPQDIVHIIKGKDDFVLKEFTTVTYETALNNKRDFDFSLGEISSKELMK